jgi:glutaredoxin
MALRLPFSPRTQSAATRLGSLVVFLVFASACDRPEAGESAELPLPVASSFAVASESFVLSPASKGVLFVWVGADGDFHTTDQPSQIEEKARNEVRVLDPERGAGSPEAVWVADVSRLEGPWTARLTPRKTWEAKGLPARAARLEAAEPKQVAAPEASALAKVPVTIYGASWCKACHLAEDYLKAKGIPVVKKDIEEDPGAQGEMASKLRRAGQSGSSIPVIDVAGTILIGFSEGALNAALARAVK